MQVFMIIDQFLTSQDPHKLTINIVKDFRKCCRGPRLVQKLDKDQTTHHRNFPKEALHQLLLRPSRTTSLDRQVTIKYLHLISSDKICPLAWNYAFPPKVAQVQTLQTNMLYWTPAIPTKTLLEKLLASGPSLIRAISQHSNLVMHQDLWS